MLESEGNLMDFQSDTGNKPMTQFEEALAAYQNFPDHFRSIVLSTVSEDGAPNASYAPFVMDEGRNIYIYISALSTHTRNLQTNGRASVLFIEDEGKTEQIFARRRLTYNCTTVRLKRETDDWNQVVDRFQARFGELIQMFRGLSDFQLYQLKPQSGRFVIGFGAAYDISADNLNDLMHVKGGGHGNRAKKQQSDLQQTESPTA